MAAGMTKKDMIRKKTENHLYFSTFEIQLVIKKANPRQSQRKNDNQRDRDV